MDVLMICCAAAAPKKRGPAFASPPFLFWLETRDVGRLQALRPGDHVEFDGLAFVQRFVSIGLNRGEVHEHIFPRLALDESIALACIKPLHSSLFFCHLSVSSSFFVKLFASRQASSRKSKKAASVFHLQPLLSNLKVVQDPQMQFYPTMIPAWCPAKLCGTPLVPPTRAARKFSGIPPISEANSSAK